MNYRLYSMTNYYLSSLQKGLQTAHVVGNMSKREHDNSMNRKVKKIFREWTDKDKTIIILNGGNHEAIVEWYIYLSKFSDFYPVAGFQEDTASLNGAYTAVGIVLPDSVYKGATTDPNDLALFERISKLSLAF